MLDMGLYLVREGSVQAFICTHPFQIYGDRPRVKGFLLYGDMIDIQSWYADNGVLVGTRDKNNGMNIGSKVKKDHICPLIRDLLLDDWHKSYTDALFN